MFFLSLIEHTVQLRPHLLDLPSMKPSKESLKVIVNLGLCISVYDMWSIDGGFVFPRDGASILNVKFAEIDDFERLRPEELNQQNIEALVAENNLILPVNGVDLALHNFVNKDDKMSFYSCVQYNLEETHKRVKERAVHSKETQQFMSGAQSLSKGTAETGSAVSFSDDEDLSQLSGSKSTTKGRSSSSATFKYSHDASEHGKDVQLREMSSFALGRLA
ncbi:hypothetical protein AAG906_012857 [Vitis piasezkii]